MSLISRRSALVMTGLAVPALMVARPAFAQSQQIFQRGGVAINGADAVAYFDLAEADGPVLGSEAHSLEWNGARWLFSSDANRAAFAANPTAYAPAYGGYCAFAAARGYVADTEAEAWTVVDGRLFLNYSLRIRRRWLREIPDAIVRADENWPGILG